jgi:hypothetical protein
MMKESSKKDAKVRPWPYGGCLVCGRQVERETGKFPESESNFCGDLCREYYNDGQDKKQKLD